MALARCSLLAMPFLACWIALTSVGSAFALLLVKRPCRAVAELADLAAFLTVWRVAAARWRARGQRRIRRRDLRGLFVKPRVAMRHSVEAIRDAVAFTDLASVRPGAPYTGSADTGSPDAGSLKTGSLKTGSLKTGSLKTGSLKTGSLKTGSLDTGSLRERAGSTRPSSSSSCP